MELYTPVLALVVLATLFVVGSLGISLLVGPRRYNRVKLDSYECGIQPTPQPVGGGRFPVKYYITAMLFIVFDIEIIFLYPWAVIFRQLGAFGLWEMLIFAVAVFVSFVYLIGNGALNWGPVRRVGRLVDTTRTTESTVRRVGSEGRTVEQGAA
ncbi:MAG TPA: NADH-quinone oxidoreductase subunit A [Acidimicrobiales bacterium]|nr:NADH-quinone oxidoreductase subunit A [Acidimicrobiales bacterium]